MKHLFSIFLLLLPLNFITPTQELQAYNYTQQDWGLRPADDLIFEQEDPNSNYPKPTVTTDQPKLRVPCDIPGNNLRTALRSYGLVPVPDLKTGTMQDFDSYLIRANITVAGALNWYAAYMNDNYIAIIKQLPEYDQKLNELIVEYGNQSNISEFFGRKFGSQPKGFVKRLRELCKRRECEREIAQAANNRLAVEQLKQQQLAQIAQRQLTVRQSWPENFQLLQQDIPEWQELSDIFLEHKFGDSARLQKRIAVLNQLTSDSNNNASSKLINA